jgi:Fibronectin type III domain
MYFIFYLSHILQMMMRANWLFFSIGYQVEKRSPGGDWEKVNDVPIAGESTTVPDLVEGENYEFRVAAVTEAGVGDYSNATPMTKAEKKKRKFLLLSTSVWLQLQLTL